MLKDPLAKNDSEKKIEVDKKQKAKDFENKLNSEAEEILQQSPLTLVVKIQTSAVQPQQPQQSTFSQIMDAPRKLFFRTTGQTQQSQQQQSSDSFSQTQKLPETNDLDITTTEILPILEGEKLCAKIASSLYLSETISFKGSFYITNYKIEFLCEQRKLKLSRSDSLQIPLAMIYRLERTIEKKQETQFLEIYAKDGRFLKLKFAKEQMDESFAFYQQLHQLAYVDRKDRIFAFSYKKTSLEQLYNGWSSYDIEKEFDRQGLKIKGDSPQDDQKYLFKYFKNTNVCSTYCDKLVVPFAADSDQIVKTSRFRSKERLPILCYGFHCDSKTVSLWRSSQCKSGISSITASRCAEDEYYLKFLQNQSFERRALADDDSIRLHIYDCRPYLSAVGQSVAGKGYENCPQFYKRCAIEFLEIHNIHKVRDAFKKLQITSIEKDLFSQIELSAWYEHIVTLINGASKVAIKLTERKNVLVHCSDGWDRTAQVVSLAQLMIDPYFRTIRGFIVIIQKEWLYAGHQFATRSGIGSKHYNDEQRSPVFIQFLDALFQLQQLYPLSFEFNSQLLLDLAYHYHSGLYGTFLCDSYNELLRFKVPQTTVSIWSYILSQNYQNPFYKSNLDKDRIIPTRFSTKQVVFWKEYFLYSQQSDCYSLFNGTTCANDNLIEMVKEVKKENQVLRLAQSDQEKHQKFQSNFIKELKILIESSQDQEFIYQMEQVQERLVKDHS